mgnify:CR=1 FL=1
MQEELILKPKTEYHIDNLDLDYTKLSASQEFGEKLETFNQKFDMIASPNEAKMTFGKYASTQQQLDAFESSKENGFYKVHKIKASSIKVTQVMDKSKTSASYPIALGEMLASLGYDSGEVNTLLKEIMPTSSPTTWNSKLAFVS